MFVDYGRFIPRALRNSLDVLQMLSLPLLLRPVEGTVANDADAVIAESPPAKPPWSTPQKMSLG